MTRQTDNWRKRNKDDHVVKCVFKKGGQHLGRDGRECRLSLAQAPWPWPVPGNTELGSAGTKAPRLLSRIRCFSLRTGSAVFHTCYVHICENNWRALPGLLYLFRFIPLTFLHPNIFFPRIRPMCQTVQLILPARFEKISELQMGPHRFQWEWVFQQVWITVIKNLFQG